MSEIHLYFHLSLQKNIGGSCYESTKIA